MSRLEKAEIRHTSAWLSNWRTPSEAQAYVDALTEQVGDVDFFTQAGLDFIRDAWLAASFGLARNADAVRLVAGEWPDCELRFGERVEQYEITEADVPGRRRGDQYRERDRRRGPSGILVEPDPVENWIKRAEQAPSALRLAAEKKLGKRYGARAGLVVYLNISEYGIRQPEIEGCMAEALAPAGDAFESVWVLWKARAYRVYPAEIEEQEIP
jgi:hypothetical protein